ncbi:hypothetical protein ACO0RG_001019 [Hanseniaspora osmophila]|uniref:Nucleolar protein 13 n=1 Tax=Hanseniaspora osmophila TaxID=56408 RepID=A0A1E5RN20_9ASCO|nr:Nucleolar protein 13 [Hanseniaspora osmophila]
MSEEETKIVETATTPTYDVEKALQDPSKKRKAEDEIEIDLKQSVPLSKKQKRMLRRGKVTLEEINKKFNIDPSSIKEYEQELKEKKEQQEQQEQQKEQEALDSTSAQKEKKQNVERFGVWVGNLSFDTTKEDLQRLLVLKIEELTESDILRINMPLQKNDGKQIRNKGFAYVDLKTEPLQNAVIALSESQLNGRNMLIKNSKNFTGRPDKEDLVAASKNPPSRILFVGNLSYDVTSELLEAHFQHCGPIARVRMATFEDSGKCKGFAFVDFKTEEGATNALKDKAVRKIASRPIRMEYGEDRSKRQVKRRPQESTPTNASGSFEGKFEARSKQDFKPQRSNEPPREFKPRNRDNARDKNNRVKSSIALANAPRASAAIVPSSGKKVTFD